MIEMSNQNIQEIFTMVHKSKIITQLHVLFNTLTVINMEKCMHYLRKGEAFGISLKTQPFAEYYHSQN